MKDKTKINNNYYIFEAMVDYFFTIVTTGAFLATILKHSDVSDKMTGIITATVSLAYLAQLFSSSVIRNKKCVKYSVIIFQLINELLFIGMYLVPGISIPQSVKAIVFFLLILFGYTLWNLANPLKIVWMMSYVAENKRGMFTANKEIISLVGGMVFTYVMGALFDYFKAAGNREAGFAICALTMAGLSVIHIVLLFMVDSPGDESEQKEKVKVSYAFVKDKNFIKLIAISVAWTVANCLTASFSGLYMTKELGFSLKFVSAISMLGSFSRIVFSRPAGRYADRKSYKKMLYIMFVVAGISFLFAAISNPSNGKLLFPVYYVLHAVALAGINGGVVNITFDYISHKDCSAALGIKTAVGGVAGFITALLGAELLECIQMNGNTFMGISLYPQQLLSLISALMCFVTVFLVFILPDKKEI